MFRIFTFYVTANGTFKHCQNSEFRVSQNLPLNIRKNSFHRIEPRTISGKFDQCNGLTSNIGFNRLRAVSPPAIQDDIKTVAPVMFAQEFKKSDDLFCRFSSVELNMNFLTMDIIRCQKFAFATGSLFSRQMRSFFAPRTPRVMFENQCAFFIKRQYPSFMRSFIQQVFNAFFSLQRGDLGSPSTFELILRSILLCVNRFARFLCRYSPLSSDVLDNTLAWGGSMW